MGGVPQLEVAEVYTRRLQRVTNPGDLPRSVVENDAHGRHRGGQRTPGRTGGEHLGSDLFGIRCIETIRPDTKIL
jgi:hypothetical protein